MDSTSVFTVGYTDASLNGTNKGLHIYEVYYHLLISIFLLGKHDVVLLKYSSHGVLVWSAQVGTSADDVGFGICIDQSKDDIYVTGYTAGFFPGFHNSGKPFAFIFSFIFNTLLFFAGSKKDMIILRFDSSGNFLWVIQNGNSNDVIGSTIAISIEKNATYLYVAGYAIGLLNGINGGQHIIFGGDI